MGHDVFHNLSPPPRLFFALGTPRRRRRYLDALANFTEKAKPADFALPADLVAGDDAYLSTGWCGVSPCTSDADCPPPFGCVFPAGSRKLLFGYFSNEPGTCA